MHSTVGLTMQSMKHDMDRFLSSIDCIGQLVESDKQHLRDHRTSRDIRLLRRDLAIDDRRVGAKIENEEDWLWLRSGKTRYTAPFGRLDVTFFKKEWFASLQKTGEFGFIVRFKPHRWLSRTQIEWRCFLRQSHNRPAWMLSCATERVCTDRDVLNALGFVPCGEDHAPCYHWHVQLPDSRSLRRLLAAHRFAAADLLEVPGDGGTQPLLIASVATLHLPWHRQC
jgi:hypothetical protein